MSPPTEAISQQIIRIWCGRQVKQHLDATVEGLEHVPQTGPVLITARHFHHLYDGCLLLATVSRPAHLLVGLDWVPNRMIRTGMELACHMARWPIVLRRDGLSDSGGNAPTPSKPGQKPVYRSEERSRYLRRAVQDAVSVLRDGHALVIFPEGYPNIDPVYTPKVNDEAFLPFQAGAITLVAAAQRDKKTRVAIVPAGLAYQRGARWQAILRFGEPTYLEQPSQGHAVLHAVEAEVRHLSAPVTASASLSTRA